MAPATHLLLVPGRSQLRQRRLLLARQPRRLSLRLALTDAVQTAAALRARPAARHPTTHAIACARAAHLRVAVINGIDVNPLFCQLQQRGKPRTPAWVVALFARQCFVS